MIREPQPFTAQLPAYGHESILEELSEFNKVFHQAEYEMVRRGARDADVYHLNANAYDEQIEKVFQDGLVFLPILRSKSYSGFSHKHFPSDELGQDVMVYGVVAKDIDVAREFKAAHNPVDHMKIGAMLGYPACCSKEFVKYWNISQDPIFEIAYNTVPHTHQLSPDDPLVVEKGDPRLYVHLRYAGLRIIPWFPCSFDCEESKERAKKWQSIIDDISPGTSERMITLLGMPTTWNLLNSMVVVDHPYIKTVATSYYTEANKIVVFK